ncbi:hypothetical protein SRDD_32450 [Serratia sp. DD3]|nr:hypothetical protein SRDD_32450 [Serratia sp. DD3]
MRRMLTSIEYLCNLCELKFITEQDNATEVAQYSEIDILIGCFLRRM